MPNTYQLSWNSKKYDWEARMYASMADPTKRFFAQYLGRHNKPDKFAPGDIVYISCAKKCIMKGVLRTGFTKRVETPYDEFVKSSDDSVNPQRGENWYCDIEITNWFMGENQRELRGNQTTFCQPTNAFWNEN